MPIEITDDRARVDDGIGRKLVAFVLDHPDLRSVSNFLLLTKDQHAFYERFGFESERDMAMMLRR